MVKALPALALVGLVTALPLTTPWRWYFAKPEQAVTETPKLLLLLGALAVLGVWVATTDPWLGAFSLLTTVMSLRHPWPMDPAIFVALGAAAVVVVRHAPGWLHRAAVTGLVALGVVEVGYAALQLAGYDPLWLGWARQSQPLFVHGTIGRNGYLGNLLAVLAPLAPVWLLPVFAAGVLLSHSLVAALALAVGLAVRFRARPAALALGAATLALVLALRTASVGSGLLGAATGSWANRMDVWGMGAMLWLTEAPWFGHGPGGWGQVAAIMQLQRWGQPGQPGELFLQAHSEYLQVAFELGVAGLACLAGWLVAHRRAFLAPAGGAFAAVLVSASAWFPFHLAVVAAPIVVILGLATAPEPAR